MTNLTNNEKVERLINRADVKSVLVRTVVEYTGKAIGFVVGESDIERVLDLHVNQEFGSNCSDSITFDYNNYSGSIENMGQVSHTRGTLAEFVFGSGSQCLTRSSKYKDILRILSSRVSERLTLLGLNESQITEITKRISWETILYSIMLIRGTRVELRVYDSWLEFLG